MVEDGVGRLLVASLHQGIADLLPNRLEFYEAWLNPTGFREGRIGLAPMAAALSFLRQEGVPYDLVAARAGEYAAQWTVDDLTSATRGMLRVAPGPLRARLAMRLVKRLVRQTHGASRAVVRWRRGRGAVDIRASLFCEIRGRVDRPMCGFYAAAIGQILNLVELDAVVAAEQCRAAGGERCVMTVVMGGQAIRSSSNT